MKQKLLLSTIVTLSMLALTCTAFAGGETGGQAELSGSVKIAGSSTVYPVSAAIAEEFNRMYPGVEIPVQSTGTGGGFKNFFIPGKTDINDASRGIKDSEMENARANGIEPHEFQVAIDAITIVVNPDAVCVDDLTVEQLTHIWRPDNPAMKWSDVDSSWPDEKIELYGPTSASGTFDFFTDKINGEEGASRSDYQGTEQDNTIVQAVSGSKYATGYFGMAYYLENKDKVNIVGGDLLKYGSKCLIELQMTPSGNRRAILKKHRSIPEAKEITFKIVEGGIIGTKEGKGFKLIKIA